MVKLQPGEPIFKFPPPGTQKRKMQRAAGCFWCWGGFFLDAAAAASSGSCSYPVKQMVPTPNVLLVLLFLLPISVNMLGSSV